MSKVPSILATKLGRLASVALLFSDPKKMQGALETYTKLQSPPQYPVGKAYPYFVVETGGEPFELLLKVDPSSPNSTMLYWKVTKEEYGELISGASEPKLVVGQQLTDDPYYGGGKPISQRGTLLDAENNSYGVIINPPVPFVPPKLFGGTLGRYLAPLVALAAGIALAPVLKGMRRNRHALNR